MYEYTGHVRSHIKKREPTKYDTPIACSKEVIQRMISPIINKAGVELELGGVLVKSLSGNELKKHDTVNAAMRIEVDSGHLEYVSLPMDDRTELLEEVGKGSKALSQYQDKVLSTPKSEPYKENNISMSDVPVERYIVKPQVTFEVNKNGLYAFTSELGAKKIIYPEKMGRVWNNDRAQFVRKESEDTSVSTFDPEVEQYYNCKISEMNFDAKPELEAAIGLVKMTLLTIISASMNQDKENVKYYKARFSILPRTSLKASYEHLTEEQKSCYIEYMNKFLSGCDLENVKNYKMYYAETTDDVNTLSINELIESIYSNKPDSTKDVTDGDGNIKAGEYVDYLSSDYMASTGDGGQSMGAMELPENASGIFELRRMPYINIFNPEDAVSTIEKAIEGYS